MGNFYVKKILKPAFNFVRTISGKNLVFHWFYVYPVNMRIQKEFEESEQI